MFVTCSITKCKTAAFIKEAVPFYILLIINLMLYLTWIEPFTTFLVNPVPIRNLLPDGDRYDAPSGVLIYIP